MEFLLAYHDTTAFKDMLEVCRSTTDEHVHLQAMVALESVRTLLIDLLYRRKYADVDEFLRSFQRMRVAPHHLVHLLEIQKQFPSLHSVIKSKIRSPGIKAFHDLLELEEKGSIFVIRAGTERNGCIALEKKFRGPALAFEALVELQSTVLLNAVPEKLVERGIVSLVDTYSKQLEEVIAMFGICSELYTMGHHQFQAGAELRFDFTRQSLRDLQARRAALAVVVQDWQHLVQVGFIFLSIHLLPYLQPPFLIRFILPFSAQDMRARFYFLNYFSMREILKLAEIFHTIGTSAHQLDAEDSSAASAEQVACPMCTFKTQAATPKCEMCGFAFQAPQELGQKPRQALALELFSYFHSISSNEPDRRGIQRCFPDVLACFDAHGKLHDAPQFLAAVGQFLENVFVSDGNDFGSTFGRAIARPEDEALHSDALVRGRDRVVFVAEPAANKMLQTVLSMFVRRGRLPEPGEVLFCTSDTTKEDIELLLLRFMSARQYGREDAIFCLADLHTLSYELQVHTVDRLHALLSQRGASRASKLVMLSGMPRQVILNSFHQNSVDLTALPDSVLQEAMKCVFYFSFHLSNCTCTFLRVAQQLYDMPRSLLFVAQFRGCALGRVRVRCVG